MGWSNWIKIPRLKKVIEISRHADEHKTYNHELAEELANTIMDIDEKILNEVTVGDITMLLDYWKKSFGLLVCNNSEHLLIWLQGMGWDYEVIHEYDFDNREKETDEFKDYEVITIYDNKSNN